jgi:predicted nucleotidyltransferase
VNGQGEAAWELHLFLSELGVPYAIIGGMAVQCWGEPRFTQDVDLTVIAPPEGSAQLIQQIVGHFSARISDAAAFARRNRVILVRASNGCPVDISLGVPGYEEHVMLRAVEYDLEPGKRIRICSAEDLIIHKAVAGRPQDIRDIEGILYRRRDALDVSYIRRWLSDFADVLTDPEVRQRFERAWKRVRNESN